MVEEWVQNIFVRWRKCCSPSMQLRFKATSCGGEVKVELFSIVREWQWSTKNITKASLSITFTLTHYFRWYSKNERQIISPNTRNRKKHLFHAVTLKFLVDLILISLFHALMPTFAVMSDQNFFLTKAFVGVSVLLE